MFAAEDSLSALFRRVLSRWNLSTCCCCFSCCCRSSVARAVVSIPMSLTVDVRPRPFAVDADEHDSSAAGDVANAFASGRHSQKSAHH